ncbi:MAG: hypothetical protein IJ521_00095 [Schwartzia sp.]|nr:hypothetical protein [Schwartzia sp. (in: firmicutes)]
MENKQKICDLLAKALQETYDAKDLLGLEYDAGREIVTVTFTEGNRIINVAMDSGTAMIRDIVNHLGC